MGTAMLLRPGRASARGRLPAQHFRDCQVQSLQSLLVGLSLGRRG